MLITRIKGDFSSSQEVKTVIKVIDIITKKVKIIFTILET